MTSFSASADYISYDRTHSAQPVDAQILAGGQDTWSYRSQVRVYVRRFLQLIRNTQINTPIGFVESITKQTLNAWDADDELFSQEVTVPSSLATEALVNWLNMERSATVNIPSLTWRKDGCVSATWFGDARSERVTVTFLENGRALWIVYGDSEQATGGLELAELDSRLRTFPQAGTIFSNP